VRELVARLADTGGFQGRLLGEAADILEGMLQDKGCTRFLSCPAALVATGFRGVLRTLLERRLFDVMVTTCGTLDHDLARTWGAYYAGDFAADDALLYREGFHRLGNVLVPRDAYGPALEKHLQPFFEDVYKEGVRRLAPVDLCRRLGALANSDTSLLTVAARRKIPIIIPGPLDGAVGNQMWLFSQRHRDFTVDLLADQEVLANLVFDAKRTGALLLGGGIGKHHTLWWNQFRGGLDYAIQITSGTEYDGSLSGAPVREAVSWGKVKPRARRVTVIADVTLAGPLLVAAVLERSREPAR
jgi:deoxyhypusine synthase